MYNPKTYVSEFLKELNEQLNETSNESETNKEDICLISMEKLEESHITLPCSHKFNYIPLYNEICEQKTKNNPLEVVKLHFNEIKCPYCRTITTGLLPYQCVDGVKKMYGVNYPLKHCLSIYKCEWVYKNGNLLGEKCNQKAGLYNNHCYCNKHINFINNKIKIEKCDSILVSGKRKGQRCGCKCFKDSKCKRHLKK